jgi:hypothetical protein
LSKTEPQAAPQIEEALTLDQWAVEQSRADKRVELLNAFVAVTRAGGTNAMLRNEWQAAYSAFANRPVA